MSLTRLVVCPACARHVRVDETACPFCGTGLPPHMQPKVAVAPPAGLGRAALYAFRVGTLSLTATAAACGGSVSGSSGDGAPPPDAAIGDSPESLDASSAADAPSDAASQADARADAASPDGSRPEGGSPDGSPADAAQPRDANVRDVMILPPYGIPVYGSPP